MKIILSIESRDNAMGTSVSVDIYPEGEPKNELEIRYAEMGALALKTAMRLASADAESVRCVTGDGGEGFEAQRRASRARSGFKD